MNVKMEGTLKARLITSEGLTQAAVEFGIAGFPNAISDMNAVEVEVAFAEAEVDFVAARIGIGLCADLINASAFFGLLRMAAVEDHAVAGLDGASIDGVRR